MPKLGAYAKEIKLGRVDRRSKEGRLLAQVRRALSEQLGGSPTPQQLLLIERAAMLQLQLAKFDADVLGHGLSEHSTRVYLAYSNSMTRTLAKLGLENAPPPKVPTLADLFPTAA